MVYVTGDLHGDFRRFTKHEREKLPFELTENDYVICCGDVGLLWAFDKEYDYNIDWLGRLPFTILWVGGNHDNYNMIESFPVSTWNGGKVRHIVQDKIIYLERGQIFNIEGHTYFTMGGARSHDICDGILDRDNPDYKKKLKELHKNKKNKFRVRDITWWEQELPTNEELENARKCLESVGDKVDYIISHCCSSDIEELLGYMEHDRLTDFFNYVDNFVDFKHWYFGHYHNDATMYDGKHTLTYKKFYKVV